MRKQRYPFLLLLSLFLTIVLSGCTKEQQQNDIPVVEVNFVVNPNSTEYLELNAVNGWVYVTGGYRGIILVRISLNEFKAFERACPYDWEQADARIEVESSSITAMCPHCKSKFILLDGSPFEGPSPYPLKQYQAMYDGNLLFVSN